MDLSEHEKEKIERLRRAMYSRSLSKNLHERERRALGQEISRVGEDFEEPEADNSGIVVAPRVIGFARTGLWWLLGAAVLFFLATVGYFGYFFLLGGGSFGATPGNINISISGPPQIEGGVPTELQLVITNRNKVPLELADLVVSYPEGTRSPTDFATDLQSQRIPLGIIEAGGTRQGTVSAVFAGKEGDHANIKVELEYRIGGSSAIFVASSDYDVVFSSSPLSLTISGNTETVSGQPVEITVLIASNANAPVKDVLFNANFPFGFKLESAAVNESSSNAKPQLSQDSRSAIWKLGDLLPGQNRTVTIRGSLMGEQGEMRVFHFSAGTRKDATATSSAIEATLANSEFPIAISKPFLGLAVSVGGASGSNIVVSPGDNVSVAVDWQNNLPTAITDAVIVAKLSGFPIDGATVHSVDGFYRSNDDVVIWDKTTSKGVLANLSPGARGKVGFSFQMPQGEALKNILNPRLDISINAAGKRVSESGVPQNLQAAATQRISLATALSLTTQGLYYSNPFGSVGPMPPKAGTETTYAIVFTVTNTTSKISGARVTAHMPPYVRWVGIYSPSSERVSFNQNDGTVTWDLGDVAPGVGLNGTTPRQAAIAIGFTPSTSQIGQEPPLMQSITLSGTDESTKAPVSRTVKDVTTNILGDLGFSSANSTVVK
ncbi:hypothetical protein A3D71_04300 [Candidatus Kaiserbacteria bacterium RIFCSPHIGHO2_02_FULL_55_20]|uniref:DUF11 domain-containing protein n=1 Tax=Candidatus Kaiserbacteria bacterium RIFCSPHIGHO2_02_FULL_55_20 TaxID=1798497 RepID=A0A1F6DWW8_9BACT|nr:MAG: hypothetical protein A2680_00255 [Candidatus Kaiserbacteria bacterium RIFCSPHIGHO2_01_FULL_55_37]OGG65903.1 MAG: hypothetical protein A3D71_04300 [Candidatus Kaiserbacteria bacterium RIFCSPHIGHO2_02_FULL_55_20]